MDGFQKPRISVVVPVFNGAPYLETCIESLIANQVDFECLIIDNGSTDQTEEISLTLSTKYPQVKYLKSKPQDLATALNTGIHFAKAEIIARLDSDDEATPMRLLQQLRYLEKNPKCIVVGGRLEYVNSDGNNLGIQHDLKLGNIILQDFYRGNPISHPSVMFYRRAFDEAGGYRSSWNKVEDLDLWMRMVKVGEIHNMSDIVTKYRIHERQISGSREASRKEISFRLRLELTMCFRLESVRNHQLNLIRIIHLAGMLHPKIKEFYKNLKGLNDVK
jgi:glycosyltransferase involved in cell wall biosynthesis